METNILLNRLKTTNDNLATKYKNLSNVTISNKNTLFILDWDDTLFPTTWASQNKIDLTKSETRNQAAIHFQELDRTLSDFLSSISKFGKIIIVTNAMPNWITVSSLVMPLTLNLVKNLTVVSARKSYGVYTDDVMEWKKMAFNDIVKERFQKKPLMNIISIGDAEYERNALIDLTQSNPYKIKFLKSLKLTKNPHHDLLIDQLKVLKIAIPELWDNPVQMCKTFEKI